MSPEHTARAAGAATVANGCPADDRGDAHYWNALIDEKTAAAFLGLTDRTLQGYRRKGGGATFIRISSRCIRYRRADLRKWAEARLRSSTSDTGSQAG